MKINQYPNAPELSDANLLLLETSAGTKTTTLQKLAQFFSPKKLGVLASNTKASDIGGLMDQSGAAFANSFVHEYSLGDRLTEEQSVDIRSGTFKLVRVGGYWTINGHKYWAAHADYMLNVGDPKTTEHHMLIIPDDSMGSDQFNSANDTSGGYIGSSIAVTLTSKYLPVIENAFGSSHVLSVHNLLSNGAENGTASGSAYFSRKLDLLNCSMIGSTFDKGNVHEIGVNKTQIAIFRAMPWLINTTTTYWTQTLLPETTGVYIMTNTGAISAYDANASMGIRPYFLIH